MEPRFVTVYAVIDPWEDGNDPVLLTLDWNHATRRRDRINIVRAVRAVRIFERDLEAPDLGAGDRTYVEEWQVGK